MAEVLCTKILLVPYMHKQVVEWGGKIFHKENFQEIFRGVENFSFPLFSEFWCFPSGFWCQNSYEGGKSAQNSKWGVENHHKDNPSNRGGKNFGNFLGGGKNFFPFHVLVACPCMFTTQGGKIYRPRPKAEVCKFLSPRVVKSIDDRADIRQCYSHVSHYMKSKKKSWNWSCHVSMIHLKSIYAP